MQHFLGTLDYIAQGFTVVENVKNAKQIKNNHRQQTNFDYLFISFFTTENIDYEKILLSY